MRRPSLSRSSACSPCAAICAASMLTASWTARSLITWVSPRRRSRRCTGSWRSPTTKTASSFRPAIGNLAPTPMTNAALAASRSVLAAVKGIPSSACSGAIRGARAASAPNGDAMLTYRVLSALLSYPTPELRAALPPGVRILCEDKLLAREQIEGVCGFIDWLRDTAQLDVEAAYIDAFDRGRLTSLHLFEHIHGESRARGEAMHRLLLRYRAHGLELQAGELPDFLPLFLEFLSTRPAREAAKHLAEVSAIISLLGRRLAKRRAPQAALLESTASLAHTSGRDASELPDENEGRDDTPAALDAAWEEAPVTFNDTQPSGETGLATAFKRVQP